MNNINYGDLYRFRASLGLALILSAVIILWFFFQQGVSESLTISEFNELPRASQEFIEFRQDVVIKSKGWVVFISVILIGIGLWLTITGVRKWTKNQLLEDRIKNIDWQLKEFELLQMTPIEARENAKADLQHSMGLDMSNAELTFIHAKQEQYKQQIAKSMYEIISQGDNIQRGTANFQKNKKLENPQEQTVATYDIVLEFSRDSNASVIINVRYFPSPPENNWLDETLGSIILSTELLRNKKSRTDTIVFLILPKKHMPSLSISGRDIRQNLNSAITQVFVSAIAEEELSHLTSNQLISYLPKQVQNQLKKADVLAPTDQGLSQVATSSSHTTEPPFLQSASTTLRFSLLIGLFIAILFFVSFLSIVFPNSVPFMVCPFPPWLCYP